MIDVTLSQLRSSVLAFAPRSNSIHSHSSSLDDFLCSFRRSRFKLAYAPKGLLAKHNSLVVTTVVSVAQKQRGARWVF